MFEKQYISKNNLHHHTLIYASLSDIGVGRELNEDAWTALIDMSSKRALLAVADGMGGYIDGDVASSLAVNLLKDRWSKGRLSKNKHLIRTYRKIDSDIYKQLQGNKGGTTCTAALIEDDTMVVANIGDSRAYLLRNERLSRLTKDDSFVQSLIDRGRISEVDALTHPKRNVILKSLGSGEQHEPSISEVSLLTDDLIMLCSDGLCGVFPDGELETLLIAGLTDAHDTTDAAAMLDKLCQTLITVAIGAGSTDNITVVLALVTNRN